MAIKPNWNANPIFVAWILLIFGTSCTVIRPEEFFALVQKFAGLSEDSLVKFRLFWGVVWFSVVKGWHFTEFLILTLLCARFLKWWCGQQTQKTIAIAMVFCIAYAASDEWHQTFVPDRFGSVQDVLIDGLGVAAAGLIMFARGDRSSGQKLACFGNPLKPPAATEIDE
jgi:hypothetical protein